jgi:F-type H+-transporting ATPase subunit a
VTTATATATDAPPKKKGGKLGKIVVFLLITTGIGFAADAILGIGSKSFKAPTVEELFEFKPIFSVAGIEVTFPTLVMFAMTLLVILFFFRAFAAPKVVPDGVQNLAEAGLVDFVRNQIAVSVIGPEGAAWTPLLATIFFWVLLNNFMSIFPVIQFPVNSRMSYPVTMALTVWLVYNGVGIKNQGLGKYFKGIMFPPGVPPGINILLAVIELFSTVIVRPITLSVRLFANMVAGHMILAVLFIGSSVFIAGGALGKVGYVAPFGLGIALMGLELFVIFMQAFIFTILTAVYISGAVHPEH